MTMHFIILSFPGGSDGKESACNAEDPGSIPGLGKSPGKEMATHSNMLAWRTLRTEKPGGLQSAELQESDATQWLKHHHLLPYCTVSSL